MRVAVRRPAFFGWRVVGGALVLAACGWGMGFYGPPVFLSVIGQARAWPLALVSTAVTVHFLVGAVAGANLPALHRRFGSAAVTKAGALCLAGGIAGWAMAVEPWQLFAATLFSGTGWGMTSASAINVIVAPWFDRRRPAALAMAYNGGSIGGVIFSPLWVAAIAALGFPAAAIAIGLVVICLLWVLADALFSRQPQDMGLDADGDPTSAAPKPITSPLARPLPGPLLWRDVQFLTLTAGMALGLFAQIGLVAHLFSLLAPVLGAQNAGLAMGFSTALAIAGRTVVGWTMTMSADRRLVAGASYAVQLAGSLALLAAAGSNVPLLLLGIVLFGLGFGNSTSLPPLIAQVEFVKHDVQRAVALIVGISQAFYAFAPAAFGLIRALTTEPGPAASGTAPLLFATAALIQGLAICAFLAGRRRSHPTSSSRERAEGTSKRGDPA